MSMTEVMRAADNLVTATNMVHRSQNRDAAMDIARECYEALRLIVLATIEAEREACAKVAEEAAKKMGDLGRQHRDDGNELSMDRCYARALQCTQIAADIRTRSNSEVSGGR